MNVLFNLNRNLIELVDRIGLDYEVINNQIQCVIEEVEYFIEDVNDLNRLTDSELCEFLLHPELKDGVIRIKYELVK